MKNWLITGGCGFIGSSLVKKLLNVYPESNIRILDNLSVGTEEDLAEVCQFNKLKAFEINSSPNGVELIEGDIRESAICHSVGVGIDVIVHLAANTGVAPSVEDPELDCVTNVIGTLNMLEAARNNNVGKFVFASSGAPIGELEHPPIHEELAPHPVSPYGASKLAGEGYCSAYSGSYGLRTIALRFGNVYGPRSKHKSSVVAKFIKSALVGEVCEVYGDGEQTRDFIYITDLVSAIIKSAQADNCTGEVFQIASNREVTVNEIAQIIKKELAELDINMEIILGQSRIGDVRRNYSDTSKAKQYLNWTAVTPLNKGVRETVLSLSNLL